MRRARFSAFLQTSGIWLDRAVPQNQPGMGLGLSAAVGLQAGEEALHVPHSCWHPLSAAAARERIEALSPASVARVLALGGGSSLADAAFLAAELALSADDSPAARLLGGEAPDVPLLCPAPLRRALLQGNSCASAVESQERLARGLCDALGDLASGTACGWLGGGDFRHRFRVGQSVLLSRAHAGRGKPLALVLGLDLLNHAVGAANATVHVDRASAAFVLVTKREVAACDPLTIDYGALLSHKFVRLYGFLPMAEAAVASGAAVAAGRAEGTARGADAPAGRGDAAAAEAAGRGAEVAARESEAAAADALSGDEEVLLQLLPPGAEGAADAEAVLRSAGLPPRLVLRWEPLPELTLAASLRGPRPAVAAPEPTVMLPFGGLDDEATKLAVHFLICVVAEQQTRLARGLEACAAVCSAEVC